MGVYTWIKRELKGSMVDCIELKLMIKHFNPPIWDTKYAGLNTILRIHFNVLYILRQCTDFPLKYIMSFVKSAQDWI